MTDALPFAGSTYSAPRDGERLTTQLACVVETMQGGGWWTLAMLANATGHPEASISARLRDLKRPEFHARLGRHFRVISDPPEAGGTWHYQLQEISTPASKEAHIMNEADNNPSAPTPDTAASSIQPIATPSDESAGRRRNVVKVSLTDEAKALAIVLKIDEEALVADAVAAHVTTLLARVRDAAKAAA